MPSFGGEAIRQGGDRHWQYHSIRPDGFEEFSVGVLVDRNSRLGRKPGDPESTDPKGRSASPTFGRSNPAVSSVSLCSRVLGMLQQ